MRVDTHRVYTILRREMLRLKRLEQLLQLAANGVNGNTGNKDLVEKISEANAIISEIKQATETGYLKKSLAYKLGLKVSACRRHRYNSFVIFLMELRTIVMVTLSSGGWT